MIGIYDDVRFNPPPEPEPPLVHLMLERDLLARRLAHLRAERQAAQDTAHLQRTGQAIADTETTLRRRTFQLLLRAERKSRAAPLRHLH